MSELNIPKAQWKAEIVNGVTRATTEPPMGVPNCRVSQLWLDWALKSASC